MSIDNSPWMGSLVIGWLIILISYYMIRQICESYQNIHEKKKASARRDYITTGEKNKYFTLLSNSDVATVKQERRLFVKHRDKHYETFYSMQQCPDCGNIDHHKIESVEENNKLALESMSNSQGEMFFRSLMDIIGWASATNGSIVRVCNACGYKWMQK